MAVVLPFARTRVFSQSSSGTPGLIVRHPARHTNVTFVGLASITGGGGFAVPARSFAPTEPGVYLSLRRRGRRWEVRRTQAEGQRLRTPLTALVSRTLDRDDRFGLDEIEQLALESCPTLESFESKRAKIAKNDLGKPVISEVGCAAYAGSPTARIELGD
jgi:hypothetical protein